VLSETDNSQQNLLKVKDHCVCAVIFTSSGVSDMDYGLKGHVGGGLN